MFGFAVLAVVTWGTALLAYPIMWFVMPEDPPVRAAHELEEIASQQPAVLAELGSDMRSINKECRSSKHTDVEHGPPSFKE